MNRCATRAIGDIATVRVAFRRGEGARFRVSISGHGRITLRGRRARVRSVKSRFASDP